MSEKAQERAPRTTTSSQAVSTEQASAEVAQVDAAAADGTFVQLDGGEEVLRVPGLTETQDVVVFDQAIGEPVDPAAYVVENDGVRKAVGTWAHGDVRFLVQWSAADPQD